MSPGEGFSASNVCKVCGAPSPDPAGPARCTSCGAAAAPGRARRARRRGRWVAAACRLYATATVGLIAVIAFAGDLWWPTTLVLFGPRWAWALPLAVLVPAAVVRSPRSLGPLAVAAVLTAGPLLGYRVPWRAVLPVAPAEGRLRVLTFNAQGQGAGTAAFAGLVVTAAPDVVLLQECLPGPEFHHLFRGPAWHVRFYNQLGLASRFPVVRSEVRPLGHAGDGGAIARYELSTPDGPLSVFNVHLETPREGLEAVLKAGWWGARDLRENIDLRRRESRAASLWVGRTVGRVVIAGDFNMPVESAIYREGWSRYPNAFSEAGHGYGATKFTRWFGIRIDHVLADPGWGIRRCRVGPHVGSDHRPLIAELVRAGGD